MKLALGSQRSIRIAVDEWNVGYRGAPLAEEVYNLEDALVVAMHFNAFIRHAPLVGMATIALGLALIDGRLLTFLKPRRA